jgi:hypothetical protein
MHDYGQEDEDAVTTVMSAPSEAEESQTISTVHEPAKSLRPRPAPDDAIVVAPTLLMPEGTNQHQMPFTSSPGYGPPPGHPTMPASGHYPSLPGPGYTGAHQATVAPADQQRSSVLIAVIAAATTLIALTLTALVVLKITESPKEREKPPSGSGALTPTATAPTGVPQATGAAPTAVVIPSPPPAVAPPVVNPDSLPKETKEPAPTAEKPKSTGGGYVAPKTAAPAPPPAEPTPPKGGGEAGFLTVVCDPGCDAVSAGGRNLGPSPVVRASLPPGNHGVGLRKGSIKKSLSVTIVSGQTTARRVKMD